MLILSTQFICDTCGQAIETPNEGLIEWISHINEISKQYETHSFYIVHHYLSSPLATISDEGCYQLSKHIGRYDNHLDHFLSHDYKMANILKFLDIGPYHNPKYSVTSLTDMRQFVETVRRLTIPYYEEERQYWQEALDDGYFQDANEFWIYGVKNLKHQIETYGESSSAHNIVPPH